MLYFDDIPDDYAAVVGTWQLTADDIVAFARIWDPQPVHVDAEAAAQSPFGGLVASSAHLFAICTRLFFDHDDHIAVFAMLGKDKLRLPNPARAGTTLTYATRCVSKAASRSRPNVGIVTLEDMVTDDADAVVLSQDVTLMVRRSGRDTGG